MASAAGTIFMQLQVGNQNGFQNQVQNICSGAANMASKVFKTAMVAAIPAGIYAGIKKLMTSSMVELASDLEETQNVVNKAFGNMKQSAESFAASAMEGFGLTELQAKRYSSTYMSMASAMGLAEDTAAQMSINLTKLSADVASFYNLTNDESYEKFKGVFSGETEPLKALGIVMTQTNLEAFALSQGIEKSYKAMTEAEKVALRYKFIMNQLSLAQGDFSSTFNGWANQMKTLSNRFDEFKTKVGNGLIKIFTPLLSILNELVQKLSNLMDTIYNKLGWSFGESATSAASDIMNASSSAAKSIEDNYTSAAETAKEALQGLAGFDQINKLAGSSASDGSEVSEYNEDGGLSFNPFGSEYANIETSAQKSEGILDKFLKKTKSKWDAFWGKYGDSIMPVFNWFKEQGERVAGVFQKVWDSLSNWWSEHGENLKSNLKIVVGVIGELVAYLWDKIATWAEKWLPILATALADFVDGVTQFIADWGPAIVDALKPVIDGLAVCLDIATFIVGALLSELPVAINTALQAISLLVTGVMMGIYALLKGIWDGSTYLFGMIYDMTVALAQAVVQFFGGMWDNIKGFFDNAKTWLSDFWNSFCEMAKAPINFIISLINKLIDGLNSISFDAPDWLGGGHFGFDIAHVPMLANGGIVTQPTLAMVGEGSQNEAVVPIDSFKQDIAVIVAETVASVLAKSNGQAQGSDALQLQVNIAGKSFYDDTIKEINRRSRNNGKCVINV